MAELLCYPGQGALPKEGFGNSLFEQPSPARDQLLRALSFVEVTDKEVDLQELYINGKDKFGNSIENIRYCQPIQVAHSLAMDTHFRQNNPNSHPIILAPHSLGQYSAIIASSGFHPNSEKNLEIGMRIVNIRAIVTEKQTPGSMMVVRCKEQNVEALYNLCEQSNVSVAVINGPGFFTLSGSPDQLNTLSEKLKPDRQYTHTFLNIERAFHNPSMKHARRRIEEETTKQVSNEIQFNELENHVILSSGIVTKDSKLLWSEILDQLHDTFNWNNVRIKALELGFTSGIELGGNRIQGTERVNAKRGNPSLEITSIPNI